MHGHFGHQFLKRFFLFFRMVACVLFSKSMVMVASISTYLKNFDWLLKRLTNTKVVNK